MILLTYPLGGTMGSCNLILCVLILGLLGYWGYRRFRTVHHDFYSTLARRNGISRAEAKALWIGQGYMFGTQARESSQEMAKKPSIDF